MVSNNKVTLSLYGRYLAMNLDCDGNHQAMYNAMSLMLLCHLQQLISSWLYMEYDLRDSLILTLLQAAPGPW